MDTFKKKTCKYCWRSYRQNTSISFNFPCCEWEWQAKAKDHLKRFGHEVATNEKIIWIDPANWKDKISVCIKNDKWVVRIFTF